MSGSVFIGIVSFLDILLADRTVWEASPLQMKVKTNLSCFHCSRF